MTTPPKHLVIACGGTGGHFYPAVATAREFQSRGGPVTLAVAGHNTEKQLVEAARLGLAAVPVKAARLPANRLLLPLFLLRLWRLRRQADGLLRSLRADAVLGMGSFATVPVCLAAAKRLPLVLHEANSLLGRANAFLSGRARVLAYSLPLGSGRRCHCPQVCTGMPLRQELLDAASGRETAAAVAAGRLFFGLQPDLPTLLVFGGSQGAGFLNDLLAATAPQCRPGLPPFQIIHLTGSADNLALAGAYAAAGIPAAVRERESAMHNAYLAADLVLCRAGASTVCELALFGRPAILVPLPTAADDHQTVNAAAAAGAGGAVALPQAELSPERLRQELAAWLAAPAAWQARGRQLHTLAQPRAAANLAELIMAQLEPGRKGQ